MLIEKNKRLGVKLSITGKGRCNITNAEEELKNLVNIYGPNGKFLYSALTRFSNHDAVAFFESRGIKTKLERGGRILPASDDAKDVINCLKNYIKNKNVEIRLDSPVEKIVINSQKSEYKKIDKIILTSGEEIVADNYLLATGGKSYPGTGSSGEAYEWLETLGHRVVEPKPALTPILVKEKMVKKLEGLSLKNLAGSHWGKPKQP